MIITLTLNTSIDKAYQISGTVCPGTVMRVPSRPRRLQRQSSITGNSIRMRKTPVLIYIIWMWDGMEVFFVKNAGVFKMSML